MWNRADWLDLHGDQGCGDADEEPEDDGLEESEEQNG